MAAENATTETAQSSGLVGESLNKAYGGRRVVEDVSVRIAPGEVVGLLGPNGAGKTTSFYLILGLVPADRGRVVLDGRDITKFPMYMRARSGIGYLPQEASIFRRLSVEDNLRAVLELKGTEADAAHDRVRVLLSEFGLSHVARTPGYALSGGERRRVEIARALATQPRFILLDEPFAGVDPIAGIEIQRIISFLKQRGIGVLITDHNVRETLGICDRAYIISEGRVLAEGTPADIVENADVRKVYLGEHFRM